MIKFNKSGANTRPLTLKEQQQAIKVINDLLEIVPVSEARLVVLQRFIDDYQNLQEYKESTEGFYFNAEKKLSRELK